MNRLFGHVVVGLIVAVLEFFVLRGTTLGTGWREHDAAVSERKQGQYDEDQQRSDEASAADAAAASAEATADSLMRANQNLSDVVREYRARLTQNEEERSVLQRKLKMTEERISSLGGDSSAIQKSDFDLSASDWAQMSKRGEVRYRLPCYRPGGWTPGAEELNDLGLAPDDAKIIHDVYSRSNERMWNQIRPVCVAAAGSAELADRLGFDICARLIEQSDVKDDATAKLLMKKIGEIRAGARPSPGPDANVSPTERLYLLYTSELKNFETDLAGAYGGAEAHRLTFSDGLCMRSSWVGRPSR
jgi:hypothetical protein